MRENPRNSKHAEASNGNYQQSLTGKQPYTQQNQQQTATRTDTMNPAYPSRASNPHRSNAALSNEAYEKQARTQQQKRGNRKRQPKARAEAEINRKRAVRAP